MKKKGRKRVEGNVILFPDLEKRLLEKGLEQLQHKRFDDAVQLFEKAKTLSPEDTDVYVGLVLAYYEAGQLQKARQLAKEMLKEGIGDYFQTVDLYLMILIQLHEHEEIITTIKVLQEEKEIPLDKQDHFQKLLDFSERMVENSPQDEESDDEDTIGLDDSPASLDIFQENDPNKQMLVIAELTHKNIRNYIQEVKDYLESKSAHPFLKTMLLNILYEQEYDKTVNVEKFGREKTLIPVEMVSLQATDSFNDIKKELQHIENQDPILFQHIISLVERHLYLIYPFELDPCHPSLWAAAYHVTGLHYNGIDKPLDEIAEHYQVELNEIEQACSFIEKLEKISYPII
jgi:tetratricopeptide (TPR) repeat protein